MNQLQYTFTPVQKPSRGRVYRWEDLKRMTLFQLRDLCVREKIIHAATDRMDREELIHLLMRFRGSRTPKLISKEDADGYTRLKTALYASKISLIPHRIQLPAKITVFEGLDTNYFDGYALPYQEDLDGVNAMVTDQEGEICALFRVESFEGLKQMYLTRTGALSCKESPIHNYRLLLFPQKVSDLVWGVYTGMAAELPPQIQVYSVPLMAFFVRQPVSTAMPLAIDFGTSNTVAGIYLESGLYAKISDSVMPGQLQPGQVNYVRYLDAYGAATPILPSVIGVDCILDGKACYAVGYAAERIAENGYLGEGISVFYDIKRWVVNDQEMEELSDFQGSSLLTPRKEILRAYLLYVISCAQQRFKCRIQNIFMPYPVKQRERFLALYRELLPEYTVEEQDCIDEGVSVIYSTIAALIKEKQYREDVWYKALIIDCGGGTTDLSSCEFSIHDDRIAYDIQIETAYENGDTDFGGNLLTYRILQLIKISAAYALTGRGETVDQLTAGMDEDLYRIVDREGSNVVYEQLERAYAAAEEVIPTRFKEYEYAGRDAYFMVKSNYYLLFTLAEQAKKAFFSNYQLLRVELSCDGADKKDDPYLCRIKAPRWKLAAKGQAGLTIQKEFPEVILNTEIIRMVLKSDIYDVISRFLTKPYAAKTLGSYNIIKLTGQSCRINLFRDCLKEFLPGRMIQQRQKRENAYELKLCCLEGAIRYISDKRLGYARVRLTQKMPAFPYVLSAYTHKGERVTLIQGLDREKVCGSISRPHESVELRLHLSTAENQDKFTYTVFCDPDVFSKTTQEELSERFGGQIQQAETDTIQNGEIKYFVWADQGQWGFSVVPVSRVDEQLSVGEQQRYSFEDEGWMVNYFDGMR